MQFIINFIFFFLIKLFKIYQQNNAKIPNIITKPKIEKNRIIIIFYASLYYFHKFFLGLSSVIGVNF